MVLISTHIASSLEKNEIVDRIVSINRAWKIALEDSNSHINGKIADKLCNQKSAWQVELYRSYPDTVWFKYDLDNYPDGSVFSVRFGTEVVISSDGDSKWNAEHLPVSIARKMLTATEFKQATNQKN